MYILADGIRVNVRLEDEANKKQCVIVPMGATADGRKEPIAVINGFREIQRRLARPLALRQATAAPAGTPAERHTLRRLQAA